MNGLIICASGVTSKMIATKIEKEFKEMEFDIKMSAIDTTNAVDELQSGKYDFYLVSPQAAFKYDAFKEMTDKPIEKIAPENYVPVKSGIDNIVEQISGML